jgi:hypothetical protein
MGKCYLLENRKKMDSQTGIKIPQMGNSFHIHFSDSSKGERTWGVINDAAN